MFKSKLIHKTGMLILAFIVVILGTSIIDKKFHILTKISQLPGEVAGVIIVNDPGKFLPVSLVGAQATAPYQNVSGDVAISGKVGIGTVSPLDKLSLVSGTGDVSAGSGIFSLTKSGGNTFRFYFGTGDNNLYFGVPGLRLGGFGTDGSVAFGGLDGDSLTAAPKFYLNGTTGKVGIGTASPGYKLDVNGNAAISSTLAVTGTVTAGSTGGATDQGMGIYYGSGISDYGRIRFYQAGNNNQNIHAFSDNWQSSTLIGGSSGGINIQGHNGVTFGSWNNPDVVFTQGGGSYFRNGSVGIGTASPGTKLDVNGTTRVARLTFQGVGGDSGVGGDYYSIHQESGPWTYPYPDLVIQNHTGIKYDAYVAYGGHQFFTGYDGTGNPAGLQMQITDAVYISSLKGAGNRAVYSDANGALTNTASDVRLKTNIKPISSQIDVLATLKKLQGIYFNWDQNNPDAVHFGTQREIGMTAQNVEQVLPELIGTNSNGYKSLNYAQMSGYLVEVVKAQQQQIEELKTRIDKLEKNR